MRGRVPVRTMHGNRKMCFLPSSFVLLDLSLESGRDRDWLAEELDYVCVVGHPCHGVVGGCCTLGLSRFVDNDPGCDADEQACQQQCKQHRLAVRVRYFLGVATEWANASLLLRILEGGFQNLVDRSIDLLFGRIEFNATAATIHKRYLRGA
jgi:hypothetical protein